MIRLDLFWIRDDIWGGPDLNVSWRTCAPISDGITKRQKRGEDEGMFEEPLHLRNLQSDRKLRGIKLSLACLWYGLLVMESYSGSQEKNKVQFKIRMLRNVSPRDKKDYQVRGPRTCCSAVCAFTDCAMQERLATLDTEDYFADICNRNNRKEL